MVDSRARLSSHAATAGRSRLGTRHAGSRRSRLIHLYELDYDVLLGQRTTPSVSYTSAKIVLVGDSGVGKTGLGWRLAKGEFKEHASTHGQQFWLLDSSAISGATARSASGAVGPRRQPDYRLIHALFSTTPTWHSCSSTHPRWRPVERREFWLRQLKVGASGKTPTLLIAARSDRVRRADAGRSRRLL